MKGGSIRKLGEGWAASRYIDGVIVLLLYALAFAASHRVAAMWGGSYYYYSLLYLPAGMRLALLWRYGPRWTPAIAGIELLVQSLRGVIDVGGPEMIGQMLGVIRSPLIYGLVVSLVRMLERRRVADLSTPPMPFGLAAVLAPAAHAFASLAWDLIRPSFAHLAPDGPLIGATVALLLGDLLGNLLVAPVLLWLASALTSRRIGESIAPVRIAEAGIIFLLACTLSLLAQRAGGQLMLTPVLLVISWIGLRCGRNVAWIFIMITGAIVLPISATTTNDGTRLEIHTMLAAIAIVGYLAGSFTDAQRRAQADIARRDRMLYQAERLKTLRAMSVAVIHEISQPLTTLSIEAKQLVVLGANLATDRREIVESAALIERKVDALADMVRRLRRFGGRAVDEPSPIPVVSLLSDVAKLVQPEAQRAGIRLTMTALDQNARVMGQEVELTQALVNVVRNAVAASAGEVQLTSERDGDDMLMRIINRRPDVVRDYPGMGVGVLVASAIVAAHGGRLKRGIDGEDGTISHEIRLPRVGGCDD